MKFAKRVFCFFFLFVMFAFIIFTSDEQSFAQFDLQAEIDQANPGAVIFVPEGEYNGSFIIDKPLTIRGQGASTILSNDDGNSVLVIEGEGVELSGFAIEQRSEQLDLPAVFMSGSQHHLSNLRVITDGMGIVLDRAHENTLQDIEIEGPKKQSSFSQSMLAREGNGIDLYVSNHNVIQNVKIRYVQDGVYIEQSEGNEVSNVEVAHSRYGFHLMFTDQTQLSHNVASENITGAMVMGTRKSSLIGNHFYKQSQHVHSQGIMLYDSHEATIYDNRIGENLIGLYMESSTYNLIANNYIANNYIGLDLSRSEQNTISENDWIGNMIPARATSGVENHIEHNYWDGHFGMDVQGERISAIPFDADLLFPAIISKKSVYQLFADSPGMLFLQNVFDVNRSEALSDHAPRMDAINTYFERDEMNQEKESFAAIIYSMALFMSIAVMIRFGGRKK